MSAVEGQAQAITAWVWADPASRVDEGFAKLRELSPAEDDEDGQAAVASAMDSLGMLADANEYLAGG